MPRGRRRACTSTAPPQGIRRRAVREARRRRPRRQDLAAPGRARAPRARERRAGAAAARPGRAARGRAGGRPGLAALHSPQTGIVDFAARGRRLRPRRRGARRRGAHGRRRPRRASTARTASRSCCAAASRCARRARWAAAAPGRTGSRRRSGARADLRIVPFRGAYLKLRADRTHLVRGQIYPVPDPSLPFLGVHLSRTIGGDVLLGPTALLAGARDAYRLARDPPRATSGATLRWPGTRAARAPLVADRRARARERGSAAGSSSRDLAPLRAGDRPWTTSSPDPRGSGLRPSAATARCSTTSRSPRRRTRCTSSTRRRRPPPPRWRSRTLVADRLDALGRLAGGPERAAGGWSVVSSTGASAAAPYLLEIRNQPARAPMAASRPPTSSASCMPLTYAPGVAAERVLGRDQRAEGGDADRDAGLAGRCR